MYSINDLKKDVLIQLEGVPYRVVDSQHVSMGRGGAVMRTKLKNLLTDGTLEKTFRAAEKVKPADVAKTNMQYLYADGDTMEFMNEANYEQIAVNRSTLGDAANYVAEGSTVILNLFNDKVIGIELPNSLWFKVIKSDPGARGDTANNALKPSTIETGLQVMVPLFINEGDTIKVDTRSGAYLERQK